MINFSKLINKENFNIIFQSTMKTLPIITAVLALKLVYQNCDATGVTRCYFCFNKCEEPLEIKDCANDFQDFRCSASHAITPNGTTQYFKGCVLSNDEYWRSRCDVLNYTPGGGCYMCDENLCNYL
ncbi:unnamed protein product [Tenebrio molitor]|jgi:hypothetical protein|nr:unnamed protein product [Tenebrio molitor]